MKLMSIREFSKKCGVTPGTIRRWERAGRVMPTYTQGGHRRYSDEMLREFRNLSTDETVQTGRIVLYCRIATNDQLENLERQAEALKMFALGRGHRDVEIITEIGDGTDMQRPNLRKLIQDIANGDVNALIIVHKDRIVPYGFELFEHMANVCGCEIIALNMEQISSSREAVDNLVTIVESFSDRVGDLPKLVAVREVN